QVMRDNRTTVIFANTRPLTEKITHDLRHDPKRRDACADGEAQAGESEPAVAAHHSALDASRRRAVESLLEQGRLKAVVTSTSLELGVDIGTADMSVQVGLPGGVARCVQRVGRSGHRLGAASRGLILAATAAEIAGAVVTARAARAGRLEPLRMVEAPLDVVCQQLLAMACAGECAVEQAFTLLRRAGPMAGLARHDFDACLDFLAGDLAAPPGAYEPEPGAAPRWSSPRIWKRNGWFGVRARWPVPGIPSPRRIGHSGSSRRGRARAADLAQRSPVALVGAGPRGCRVPRRGSQAADAGGAAGPAVLVDRVARSGAQGRGRPGRADRGARARQRGSPPARSAGRRVSVNQRAGTDLRVSGPAPPRSLRGARAGDRGPT